MKKLMIATILTLTTGAVVVQPAFADYDPVGSALLGGIAGAVVGHVVGGRNGAAVGAAIGTVGGALVASQPRPYYGGTVYANPVPTTYYPAPTPVAYYPAPAPVTYYRTTYYPVHQVVYYGDRGWGRDCDHGWDHGWDHDRGWHRGWDHDRGYY